MKFHFFAYMARMKYIKRWGLMRSFEEENIMEHSLQTAMVAHALALISKRIFGNEHIDPEHIMAIAAYHETSEVMTGDLPTPVKYFNPEIRDAYKEIEEMANDRMLKMLPSELKEDYRKLIQVHDSGDYVLVKAADKICAYLKCVQELRSGNPEFKDAEVSLRTEIEASPLPEVGYFMEHFAPGFELSLDQLKAES